MVDKQEPWESVQCTCGGTIYFKHTKKEWVGLTDEEIMDRWPCETRIEFARWVEAKLKEKNNG